MTSTQTEKIVKEYTALAPVYDHRWSNYLDASLRMTMDVVGRLPAERVLDVACGTGLLLEELAGRRDNSELVGVDRVPAMLDVARRRIGHGATLLECDAAELPFDDASFRLAISTSALHYFPDAVAALREIRRVISASGNLVLTDWCRDYVWMRILNRALPWTSHAHVHTFSTSEAEQCLALAGFKVVGKTRKKIDWFWGLMTIHAIPD
jgi:ubiquinone/menaquinone biosynthesis C-methylase UbiE